MLPQAEHYTPRSDCYRSTGGESGGHAFTGRTLYTTALIVIGPRVERAADNSGGLWTFPTGDYEVSTGVVVTSAGLECYGGWGEGGRGREGGAPWIHPRGTERLYVVAGVVRPLTLGLIDGPKWGKG